MKINVKYIPVSEWEYDYYDGVFKCLHEYLELEKACCNTPDETGYISCGCGGYDTYYCPDCDQDVEVEDYE